MICLRELRGCVKTRLVDYTIQNTIHNIFYFIYFLFFNNNYKTGYETKNIVSTSSFNNILSYKFKL